MPKVSVIIPNYNHALYLKQRIESVINQTYQNFDIIILDDYSTDNSKEIIESYRLHSKVSNVIFNESNSGSPFKQWKKGVDLARGEYIWIAESDDWCELNFLEVLIVEIQGRPNVGICFSDSNWVDTKGNIGKDLSIHKKGFFKSGIVEIREGLINHNTIQNVSSALMKKEIVDRYINETVEYKSCGDWRLYIDILQNSDIVFVGKKLNNFRWYHNNTSNKATENGLWISEGVKILAFSNAYKANFSPRKLLSISKFWFNKSKNFTFSKRLQFQSTSIFYLSIFILKSLINKLSIRGK
ncbi:MAG: glycosyl transferase family 2 [Sphingobacteriales bacterium]|nr:glycosyl transferase family 2 [Sphingobacteriales bacterium]